MNLLREYTERAAELVALFMFAALLTALIGVVIFLLNAN